ncbi:MAG: hypothetical protein QOE55_6026 [Acidobacteriaceae bacterium]|nr:hypothetical protein [Acidobacteriaceae bacterium]
MQKAKEEVGRRKFLQIGAKAAAACTLTQISAMGNLYAAGVAAGHAAASETAFKSLFDGKTLNGWTPKPRLAKEPSLGLWKVENGMIVGGQDPTGVGSYLVSDQAFADFELEIDAKPDWPADTGIYVRANAQGTTGFQVNVDYRPHGTLGGYFGNGFGSFHAYEYGFTAEKDTQGRVTKLIPGKPSQPNDVGHLVTPDYMVAPEQLLRVWRLNDWNQFRIRSVGAVPTLMTWVNDLKVSELVTAKMVSPGWDPKVVVGLVGRAGHISLEVHNNAPGDWLGTDRWAPGAVCRWRNIRIREL